MHILEAPRNKPLSNDSFGPATMVDHVKYYVRVSSTEPTMSAVLELADGIDEFWRILCSNTWTSPFQQNVHVDVEVLNPSGVTSYLPWRVEEFIIRDGPSIENRTVDRAPMIPTPSIIQG